MPKRDKNNNEIAYQRNDVIMKLFIDECKGKSLNIFDKTLPEIKETLPTNLPNIKANELRIDNLFLLEDDTFLIVDYESAYKEKNKFKYGYYAISIGEKHFDEYPDIKIQILILYTTRHKPKNTKNYLDLGAVNIHIKEIFLTDMDSKNIKEHLFNKLINKEKLTKEELIQLIILPMTYEDDEEKQKNISEVISKIKFIDNNSDKVFVLTGINVFSNSIISDENSEKIKEMIEMITTAGKKIEEDKKKYAKEKVTKVQHKIVRNLLVKGFDSTDIAQIVEDLSINQINEIKKELD